MSTNKNESKTFLSCECFGGFWVGKTIEREGETYCAHCGSLLVVIEDNAEESDLDFDDELTELGVSDELDAPEEDL